MSLVVGINHDSALLALLPSVGPSIAAGPLPVAYVTLELAKHAFTALIESFL